ncbi:MAG: hypothetical protein AAGA27_03720 [Pseudomonadota bacterium]
MKKLLARTFLSGFIILLFSGNVIAGDTIWHIKAIDEHGKTLDVKAFYDKNPNQLYPVKAIERESVSGQDILDIKVLNHQNEEHADVKIIKSGSDVDHVKGVLKNGDTMHIKAITDEGKKLDIKSLRVSDNNFNIKAIGPNNTYYAIKAISPKGVVYDVKGIKMLKDDIEMTLGKQDIHAHVKAISP